MISIYGEALVDLVPRTAHPLADLAPALGGGPFTVAVASARLGAPGTRVNFSSRLSTDAFGAQLLARLEGEGVCTDYVERGPEPTTLAVTSLDAAGSASYTFYTSGTADRFAHPRVIPGTSVAYVGTCSLALEPAASRYVDIVPHLADAGAIIALDPNIRPAFATEAHRDRLRALLPYIDVLKLSEEEVDFLGEDWVRAVPVSMTTRGGEGVSVRAHGLRLDVSSVPVTVADTIGAGDTVMAVLLTFLDSLEGRGALAAVPEDTWRSVAERAVAAAAVTCSRVGAQPPRLDELPSLA